MFGKNPQMSELEVRKQLLVAESELNRAQLAQEWQIMAAGVHSLTDRVKSISSVALAGSLLIGGLMYFWRIKSAPVERKPSWWQILLKGGRLAASLWSQFGPRPKHSLD
jgi:hypothetical protein